MQTYLFWKGITMPRIKCSAAGEVVSLKAGNTLVTYENSYFSSFIGLEDSLGVINN
jgi:hypothetical protein